MSTPRLLACLLITASLAFASFSVMAQRVFPDVAKRGRLSMEDYPRITLDGRERRLAPGAWIRNANNTIDVPASLAGKRYLVNYVENAQGDLERVWLLTPDEATRPLPERSTMAR